MPWWVVRGCPLRSLRCRAVPVETPQRGGCTNRSAVVPTMLERAGPARVAGSAEGAPLRRADAERSARRMPTAAEAFRSTARAPTALQAAKGRPRRKLPRATHLQKQRFAVTRIAATIGGQQQVDGKGREHELRAKDDETEQDPIQHARTIGEESRKILKDT